LLRGWCNYIVLNVGQLSALDSLALGAVVEAYASGVRQARPSSLRNRLRDFVSC